jgi:hypothetical protein
LILVIFMQMRRATSDGIQTSTFRDIASAVAERTGLKLLIAPAIAQQSALLGVQANLERTFDAPDLDVYRPTRRSVVRAAEVLTDGTQLLVMLLRDANETYYIEAPGGEVTTRTTAPTFWTYVIAPHLNDPLLDVVQEIATPLLGVELTPYEYSSDRFDAMSAESGRTGTDLPTSWEIDASELLRDRATRTLATAIKASGGLLVGDLARQLPVDQRTRVDDIRTSLASLELITSEYFVVCKKTQTQAARVPTREVLDQIAAQGVRCGCGQPIISERVEEAVSISDQGRRMLDGSRWFSVLLLSELLRLGVRAERILLEHTAGGDEMDCIADISGDIVLFELKDKEFNIGNAYSFGAKLNIVRPEHPVIITSEYVGNDAKEHFERSQLVGRGQRSRISIDDDQESNQLTYIEGVDNMADALAQLVSNINAVDARRILRQALPHAALGADDALQIFDPTCAFSSGGASDDQLATKTLDK